MTTKTRGLGWVALLGGARLLGLPLGHGDDLFRMSGMTTDGLPPVSFSTSSQSIPTLVEDLVLGSGAFGNLANRSVLANLDYASVAQALQFRIDRLPGGTWTAELQSPFEPGLILRSFAAPTRAELESQIEDYLKKDGTSDLARWLKALDARTATGVMDGNPNSTTALTAGYVYSEYGMSPVTTRAEIEEGYDPEGTVGFALLGDVGFIRVEGYDAQSYSVNPFLPVRLSSRVRLDVGLPLNYTEVEGSQVFRGGLQFGLPILIVKRNLRENQRWLWQLAPSAGLQLAGSLDQLSGGMLVSFGGTSLLSYHFGPLEISLGNQITAHESLDVTFGDYSFDPDISSQILKNGLKVGVPIGKHWFAEAYAIDTELLGGDTAMTRYTTVGGGFGFRKNTKKRAYLMVGGYAQFGDDWSAASVQFGTGWKF